MNRQVLFIVSLLLVIGNMAMAERVDVKVARKVAESAYAQITGGSDLRSFGEFSLVYTASSKGSGMRNASADSDYFVFNVGNDQGFVIVSGDDCVRPVLAFSDKGHFDPAKMPANIASWLEGYQDEISWAIAEGLRPTAELRDEWNSYLNGRTVLRADDGVLLETAQWDQIDPYNKMTPMLDGERTLTGCVATSMAIVMRYYKYPSQVVNPPTKNIYYVDGKEHVATIDYNGTYNWDNMPLSYWNVPYTEEQAKEVSRLMWHCGVNAETRYGLVESWAFFMDQLNAMRDVFGFSKSARRIERNDFTWDEWVTLLRNELDQKRLVFYDGQMVGEEGGHAFICDGYTSGDYFHINWGWGGYLNDFFLLTALAPVQEINYSRDCGMTIGLEPSTGSEVGTAELRYFNLECEPFPLRVGEEFSVCLDMKNVGSAPTSDAIDFGFGVVDAGGEVDPIFTSTLDFVLDVYYSVTDLCCTLTLPFPLSEGERIVPICKAASGEWVAMGRAEDAPLGIDMNGYVYPEDSDKPTSNAEVDLNGLKVWASSGSLHIQTPVADIAHIYTYDGQLRRKLKLSAGETTVDLQEGIYIIYIGKRSYKLRL